MSVADLIQINTELREERFGNEVTITPELQKTLDENGYYLPKIISGKLCALSNYMFTTGLVVDIGDIGYERRYCFQHYVDALLAMDAYEDLTQHAPGDWIKCKGRFNGQPIDALNPKL
mgnify:CR=1 FL=1